MYGTTSQQLLSEKTRQHHQLINGAPQIFTALANEKKKIIYSDEPDAQRIAMADNDLLDYEDEEDQEPTVGETIPEVKKPTGGYVSIHSSGFRDFLLKPELLRAIVDCGFEHPSEGDCALSLV
ncbi:hypothetical protein HPB49_008564 [Dermacentor silvarum]|uniref:Uncharacterized protein n=1 Tax=Dermacentor silvarum TaxID=543639 RepID=A0ACB8DXT9_DERSI|nr:hypothetical protein HPB49_008564 [Dermacentor silvarum]